MAAAEDVRDHDVHFRLVGGERGLCGSRGPHHTVNPLFATCPKCRESLKASYERINAAAVVGTIVAWVRQRAPSVTPQDIADSIEERWGGGGAQCDTCGAAATHAASTRCEAHRRTMHGRGMYCDVHGCADCDPLLLLPAEPDHGWATKVLDIVQSLRRLRDRIPEKLGAQGVQPIVEALLDLGSPQPTPPRVQVLDVARRALRHGQRISFRVEKCEDEELTCIGCRAGKCDLMVLNWLPHTGRREWWGLHSRCFELVKEQAPHAQSSMDRLEAQLAALYLAAAPRCCGCGHAATKTWSTPGVQAQYGCDEHAKDKAIDLPNAPAVREGRKVYERGLQQRAMIEKAIP